MAKLTALKIRNLDKPGRYGDGDGLHLRVSKGGAKAFILRKIVDGQRKDIPPGRWPDLSLADARQRASEIRLMIGRGQYRPEAQEKAVPTFREIALETHRTLSPGWRNEKGKVVWLQRMEKHIFPHFGDTPINEISRVDVISALGPIWAEKRETSRKLLQYLNATFRLALAKNLIEINPANTDGIRGALPRLPMNRTNLPAVHWREFPDVFKAVETSGASLASRLCFAWISFTIVRGNEARGARWEEIDTDDRLWRVPASRMKSGKSHDVYMSDGALRVLEDAEALRDESGLIFPSNMRRGNPLSDAAMMNMIRKLGLKGRMSVHGVRSCFRSWAFDAGKPREIAEGVLAHATGDLVERAYIRTSALELRAQVLSEWGRFVLGEHSNKVVQLHS